MPSWNIYYIVCCKLVFVASENSLSRMENTRTISCLLLLAWLQSFDNII
jgi:hypothetical protein